MKLDIQSSPAVELDLQPTSPTELKDDSKFNLSPRKEIKSKSPSLEIELAPRDNSYDQQTIVYHEKEPEYKKIDFVENLKQDPTFIEHLSPSDLLFLKSIVRKQAIKFESKIEPELFDMSSTYSQVRSRQSIMERPISPTRQTMQGFSFTKCKSSEIQFRNAGVTVYRTPGQAGGVRTVSTAVSNFVKSVVTKSVTVEQPILHTSSGIIPSGSMTLVLGAPGSGKTTLLKLLCGRLPQSQVRGDVTLNGRSLYRDKLLPQKTMAFISSQNMHLYSLTVRETFMFAYLTGRSQNTKDRDSVAARVDALIDILGLKECQNTIVGNDLNRGVSGGQRRRVTLGEMLAHGDYFGFCMDEISTGQLTFLFVHFLSSFFSFIFISFFIFFSYYDY